MAITLQSLLTYSMITHAHKLLKEQHHHYKARFNGAFNTHSHEYFKALKVNVTKDDHPAKQVSCLLSTCLYAALL